jgi:hypothetical protein
MDTTDTVQEIELIRALIRWGKFQVQKDGDEYDGEKLRSKILPCLNLINIAALSHKEFASLCLEELGAVLSAEEKHSIMMAIIMEDLRLMPSNFNNYNNKAKNQKRHILIVLPLEGSKLLCKKGPLINNFQFYLSKKANFVGFKLKVPENGINTFTFEITPLNNRQIIWKGSLEKCHFPNRCEEFYKVSPVCSLEARIYYYLKISCPSVEQIEMFATKRNKDYVVTSDGMALQVLYFDGLSIIEAMMFEK